MHESWLPSEHPLHRPRHGGQGMALVCAAVFFVVPLLAYLVGIRPASIENHKPRDFPSLGDGWGFLTNMSGWATDNLPFRELAIQAEDGISRSLFGEPPNYGGAQGTGPIPSNGSSTTGGADQQPVGAFPLVIEGKDGWMYLGFDQRGKCEPSQPLSSVFGNVQRLREAVEQSGRRFVLVVAPDKSTMVPEKLPDSYPGKACSVRPRQEFWQRANAELQVVDLRQALDREGQRRNGPVYFPQDTHWNFAGGLVMVRQLAERLRPGITDTWKSNLGPQSTLGSDLPPMIGKTGTNRSIMYGLLPDGKTDRTNFTNLDFLNQTLYYDTPPLEGMIDTQATMFADSFTQFAAPYLAAAFNRMSITHLAMLQKNPRDVAGSLTYGKTVIVEVVERNLAAGISTISDPAVVDALVDAVRAQPLR